MPQVNHPGAKMQDPNTGPASGTPTAPAGAAQLAPTSADNNRHHVSAPPQAQTPGAPHVQTTQESRYGNRSPVASVSPSVLPNDGLHGRHQPAPLTQTAQPPSPAAPPSQPVASVDDFGRPFPNGVSPQTPKTAAAQPQQQPAVRLGLEGQDRKFVFGQPIPAMTTPAPTVNVETQVAQGHASGHHARHDQNAHHQQARHHPAGHTPEHEEAHHRTDGTQVAERKTPIPIPDNSSDQLNAQWLKVSHAAPSGKSPDRTDFAETNTSPTTALASRQNPATASPSSAMTATPGAPAALPGMATQVQGMFSGGPQLESRPRRDA